MADENLKFSSPLREDRSEMGDNMSTCENLATCPFYNDKMDINSGLGALYKRKYCENENTSCARYRVASTIGKEYVTPQLYPNMHAEADKLIQEHS